MTVCDFSHSLDLSDPPSCEAFLNARSSSFKAQSLRQQGETELKHASKERDFFKAGEIRKEAESKISEANSLALRTAREIEKISASLLATPSWTQLTRRIETGGDEMTELLVENCAVDVFILSRLLELPSVSRVKKLNLAGNDVGDVGAFLLAERLTEGKMEHLEMLDLRNCGFSTDGCVRLVQTMLGTRQIKLIDLRFNGLADRKPLTEAVNSVTKLRGNSLEILH